MVDDGWVDVASWILSVVGSMVDHRGRNACEEGPEMGMMLKEGVLYRSEREDYVGLGLWDLSFQWE